MAFSSDVTSGWRIDIAYAMSTFLLYLLCRVTTLVLAYGEYFGLYQDAKEEDPMYLAMWPIVVGVSALAGGYSRRVRYGHLVLGQGFEIQDAPSGYPREYGV